MHLADILKEIESEKTFKGPGSKDYSSFLKSPSRKQIDYFINNLNESAFNMKKRDHQRLITLSCLMAAPLFLGSKGNFRFVLSSNHSDFDKILNNYLDSFEDEFEFNHEFSEVLTNLSELSRINPSSPQKKQIKILSDCSDKYVSKIYANVIAPLLGYHI